MPACGLRLSAANVGIVNEAFVRRYFNGANPVGRTIVDVSDVSNRRAIEIVGVVEDAAFTSVRDPIETTLYRPLAQGVDEEMMTLSPAISLSVRATPGVPPARLITVAAAAIGSVDKDLSVTFQTLSDTLNSCGVCRCSSASVSSSVVV